MSVGVHSGTFHFFLVGESHREFMVTGPAASRTVDMESTATAGEILVSRDTAAALPSKVLGQPKGEGILLRSGPATLPFERDDVEVPLTWIDIAQAIPVALREHLCRARRNPSTGTRRSRSSTSTAWTSSWRLEASTSWPPACTS